MLRDANLEQLKVTNLRKADLEDDTNIDIEQEDFDSKSFLGKSMA